MLVYTLTVGMHKPAMFHAENDDHAGTVARQMLFVGRFEEGERDPKIEIVRQSDEKLVISGVLSEFRKG